MFCKTQVTFRTSSRRLTPPDDSLSAIPIVVLTAMLVPPLHRILATERQYAY
jgi:hypothetical protein